MHKVYGDIRSGNCYKIKLLMSLLGVEHEWIPVDILKSESRTPAFLQKNPNGKIPVLEMSDGTCLSESNAILNYLADGTEYLPAERLQRARVLQWQFFEQYSHEPYIAVARYIAKYLGMPENMQQEYHSRQDGGYRALHVMETQLEKTPYIAGDRYTISDVSLYAYTHVAHEGGFNLIGYPAVQQWLQRVADHPRHVTMEQFAA